MNKLVSFFRDLWQRFFPRKGHLPPPESMLAPVSIPKPKGSNRCPRCSGTGVVPGGKIAFYNAAVFHRLNMNIDRTCPSCHGRGKSFDAPIISRLKEHNTWRSSYAQR